MISFLTSLTVLSYREPRAGMRAVLERIDSYQAAFLLFMISNVAGLLISIAISPGFAGTGPVITSLLFAPLSFAVSVVLTWRIGQALGGKGSMKEIAVMSGWASFVTLPILLFLQFGSILTLLGTAGNSIYLFISLFATIFLLWQWTGFLAETHGFASRWRSVGVIALMVVVMVIVMLLFSSVLGGLS